MILEYLLGSAGFVQVLVHGALFFFRPQKGEGLCPGLSVVVCGRNAASHWKQNLPKWLECKTKEPVEFVLVDDASQDDSWTLLNEFAELDNRIKVLRLPKKQSLGKRDALTLGISHASHAQIFATDADCQPDTSNFLRALMEILGAEPGLFVGNGLLKSGKSVASLVATAEADRLARMNFAALPFLGFTTALGRNMAYPKETGLAALRYSKKFGTAGGDDDLGLPLLVSRCKNKRYAYRPCTLSNAPNTFGEWVQQKKRHWKTAPHYPWPIQVLFSCRWLLLAVNTIGLFSLPFLQQPLVLLLIAAGWALQLGSTLFWVFAHQKLRKDLPQALFVYLMAEILAIFVPIVVLLYPSSQGNSTWSSRF